METVLLRLAAAIGVFGATNLDDIVVLTVLFLESRASGQPKVWQIWAGQYAGIFALVAASVGAALGLTLLPDAWVGLLGIVPIALGVRSLLRGRDRDSDSNERGDEHSPGVLGGVLSVAALTIANGADNVSVYTPMFRALDLGHSLLTLAVFAVMPALWCIAGSWLGTHRSVIALVERAGHWLVPSLFVLIGGLIIIQSGVIGRLLAAR